MDTFCAGEKGQFLRSKTAIQRYLVRCTFHQAQFLELGSIPKRIKIQANF